MFCKYCGNEMGDDAAFCSKCGKAVEENAVKDGEASSGNDGGTPVGEGNSAKKKAEDVAAVMEKTNPLCIAAIILTGFSVIFFIIFWLVLVYDDYAGAELSLFFVPSFVLGVAGLVFSVIGYFTAHKYNLKGKLLAVIGMTLCAVTLFVMFSQTYMAVHFPDF